MHNSIIFHTNFLSSHNLRKLSAKRNEKQFNDRNIFLSLINFIQEYLTFKPKVGPLISKLSGSLPKIQFMTHFPTKTNSRAYITHFWENISELFIIFFYEHYYYYSF